MPSFKLPSTEEVEGLIQMFVPNSKVASANDSEYAFVAEFVDDQANLVSLCMSDFNVSAALGAALSMIPPAAVEEMCSSRELTPIAQDNLYEIMNIFSTIMMDDGTPHLKLARVVPAGESTDLADQDKVESVTYGADLGPYGKGAISFRTI